VGEVLKRGLHLDVPFGRDVVRRDEHPLPLRRHLVAVDVARLGDPLHQGLGVPSLLLRDRHEIFIHVRHEHAGLVSHERDREQRLDARGAPRDDRDRAGGRHRGEVAIAQPPHRADALTPGPPRAARVRPPDRPLPLREHTALLRQLLRRRLRLLVHELHHLATERHTLVRVVGNPQPHEQIGPTHHAQADAADPLGQLVDLRQRILVGIDHVVEEVRAQVHHRAQPLPVDLAPPPPPPPPLPPPPPPPPPPPATQPRTKPPPPTPPVPGHRSRPLGGPG